MVLNITCHDSCRFINNTNKCGEFPGCEWFPATDAMGNPVNISDAGSCGPNADQSYGSTGWIGIVLSLVGDIVIKFAPHCPL